jgi:hypothetical protein|tara:strand:- start:6343 stop:6462 length:120 start_codon:yes stop_codon:yes gene_type:complete
MVVELTQDSSGFLEEGLTGEETGYSGTLEEGLDGGEETG